MDDPDPSSDSMPSPPPRSTPVDVTERVLYWDVLRGFAVLGVLLANMPLMSMSSALEFGATPTDPALLEKLSFGFIHIFAETKFVTIFSVLFGAGLAFMGERADARGVSFTSVYHRRLSGLLLLGLLHGLFVWFGDILTHYAIVGFVAMWMRRWTPKAQLRAAAISLLLGLVLSILFATADPSSMYEFEDGQTVEDARAAVQAEYHTAFSSGDFAKMLPVRGELFLTMQLVMGLMWGLRTLGLFLIGMQFVTRGRFATITENLPLAKRVITIGLLVGVPFTTLNLAALDWTDTVEGRVAQMVSLYMIGLALAPVYMGLIAIWSARKELAKGLRLRLAAVGRMALTNYLAQSVITAIIFNYGRLYDQFGRFEGLLLTFAIYAFQLWFSPWWLARFRFGPMEWMWRCWVHGRQPLRSPLKVRHEGARSQLMEVQPDEPVDGHR